MGIDKVTKVEEVFSNYKKFKYFAHKLLSVYTKDKNTHEELDNELYSWINRACELYDPSRGASITTYIYTMVKRNVLKFIRGVDKITQKEVSLEELFSCPDKSPNIDITLDSYLTERFLLKYINKLPHREAIVLKLSFGLGGYKEHTLIDIAKVADVTVGYIHYLKKHALNRLASIIKKRTPYNIGDFIYD